MPRTFLSRRQAHAGLLGALLWSATAGLYSSRARAESAAGALPKPSTVKYFTAKGAGSNDGSSWQDAMPIVWLKRSFPLAEPGTAYFIGFDRDGMSPVTWRSPLASLSVSGAAGNPVQIMAGYVGGAGSDFAKATEASIGAEAAPFFKSEKDWSVKDSGARWAPRCAIGLSKGASHVAISGFRVRGAGADGFIKFAVDRDDNQTFDDVLIRDIRGKNVGRIIETAKGALLRNVTVEDCDVTGIIRGFARFWKIEDSTLRNLTLDADHQDGGLRGPCQLISINTGNNVTLENITLKNAFNRPQPGDKQGKVYIQGDGIVCERGTKNITIKGCHASGMGDGGFDVKTTNITIEDSSAEACKFGARIWSESDNAIRRCSFKSPAPVGGFTSGCVQAAGRLTITDTTLEVGPGTCGIHLHQLPHQGPPTVEMTGGAITLKDGAKLAIGQAGAVLQLNNVAVNGETMTKRISGDGSEQMPGSTE